MYENTCCSCMSDTGGKDPCPNCGNPLTFKNEPLALQPRVILNKQYLIGKTIGSGGFGITYLGLDLKLRMPVVIKEFLPKQIARRLNNHKTISVISPEYSENYEYSLSKFMEEAQTLAKFNHPNIVPILFFFEENNTAYFVMRYIPGKTLQDHVKEIKRSIEEQEILSIMIPILDGLKALHNIGMLHRDIKPKNIFIPEIGKPILIDFGAARQAISNKLSILVTHGYAPLEQYSSDMKFGKQGPWTDIYACAATLYACMIGYNYQKDRLNSPTKAPDRQLGEILPDIKTVSKQKMSDSFARAVMKGLEMDICNRPQTVSEFQAMLKSPQLKQFENNFELKVIAGEFEGELIPLTSRPLIIGRDLNKSDLVLSSKSISGTHCQFHTIKNKIYVEDLNSKNGTFINNMAKLKPHQSVNISSGDTISLAGKAVFKVIEIIKETLDINVYPSAEKKITQTQLQSTNKESIITSSWQKILHKILPIRK